MKLVFLCGSLEPGRDGVGDYTRRLAGELIRNDHHVLLIALNDRAIENLIDEEQESQGVFFPVLRLPETMPFKRRLLIARDKINNFNPEWISLQYVPFSFQKKGLPFGFAKQLKNLATNKKWHIMFHELWVGMNREASLKFKLWGTLQEKIINDTILLLNPALINTQSRLHKSHLEEMGHQVDLLPLFSNFEVVYKKQNRDGDPTLRFLVFGSIHPGAPFKAFAKELAGYGKSNNKKIHFTFLGKCARGLDEWVGSCEDYHFGIEILGEQEPEIVSEVMSKADYGVSSTPYYLYEKSGTVVAMIEHKLPVLCVAAKFTPSVKVSLYPCEVTEYSPDQLDLDFVKNPSLSNSLEKTGRMFAENLSLASSIN